MLAEQWRAAGAFERFLVRFVVPRIIWGMFDTIVHPGVYATVGLPRFSTWHRANRTPYRVGLRRRAARPIVKAILTNTCDELIERANTILFLKSIPR